MTTMMTPTNTTIPRRRRPYRSCRVSWALAVSALGILAFTNKSLAFRASSLPPPSGGRGGAFRGVRYSGTTITPSPFLCLLRFPSSFTIPSPTLVRETTTRSRLVVRRHYMNRDELHDNVAIEETLLRVHVTRIPYADLDATQIYTVLLNYTRSFPFAAVLPVQPLTYLPAEGGVDVQFLRKKTPDKPSIDGGIRIRVQWDDPDHDDYPDHDNDHDDPASSTTQQATTWTITATRNSEGQSIAKTFAEKLVVSEYLDGLTGKSLKYVAPASRGDVQPREVVEVTSVYHKWITERR